MSTRTRSNGRGKRKKKSNLSDRKTHNTPYKKRYLHDYHEKKKLQSEIEKERKEKQKQKQLKQTYKKQLQQHKQKNEYEMEEIIYENDNKMDVSDGYNSNESDFMVGEEVKMDSDIEKHKMKLIGYVLKILQTWIQADVSMEQIKEHLDFLNEIDGKTDVISWSKDKIKRFLECNGTELLFMILSLKCILFCDKDCGVMWDSSTKTANNKKYKFMSVVMSYSAEQYEKNKYHKKLDNSDVAKIFIAYDVQFSGDANGAYAAVKKGIKTMDI
eukprot:369615_1